MPLFQPDPTFYPSAKLAGQAPRETLAYVAALTADGKSKPDALLVVDIDPRSAEYGKRVGELVMPYAGDELHHYGWNACSSALCPYAPHPHVERRYFVVPGLRSSRIYVIDVKPDPKRPRIVKTIEPEELSRRSGYSRPHTVHCGPEGLYVSALGGADGEGPGGIFLMDHVSFDVLGRWELDRGPQYLAYDFWWHIAHDVLISSEWAPPRLIENGLVPQALLNGEYGRRIHFWDLRKRRHLQTIDLGEEYQMALELRPAHDPRKTYGFLGVVVSLKDLSSSIWVWHRDQGEWAAVKVVEIPAEPCDPSLLPPLLQPFGAVPPLLTDINLSLDDRFLYASAWGTGELLQFDVTDPFHPKKTGSIRLGGIVGQTPHPAREGRKLNGAPQMVEIARDGRRVFFTNSLYAAWDDQFYPAGLESWMAIAEAAPEGGMTLDENFFLETDDYRLHQIRLEGGDASSDSYCYP